MVRILLLLTGLSSILGYELVLNCNSSDYQGFRNLSTVNLMKKMQRTYAERLLLSEGHCELRQWNSPIVCQTIRLTDF